MPDPPRMQGNLNPSDIQPNFVIFPILLHMATLPGYGADGLGLHGVADGDVALDREGGEAEGAGVDAQVLQVDHQGAADRAPHPLRT